MAELTSGATSLNGTGVCWKAGGHIRGRKDASSSDLLPSTLATPGADAGSGLRSL